MRGCRFTGKEKRCINLGSYNYLGFASPTGECAEAAEEATRRYGLALASSRLELGSTPLHAELERTVADFLGVEVSPPSLCSDSEWFRLTLTRACVRAQAAVVFGMGFATNALGLAALVPRGALVLSDENNHASLILGLRVAGAAVRVFRHNDVRHLERLARAAVAEGHWTKIVIVSARFCA